MRSPYRYGRGNFYEFGVAAELQESNMTMLNKVQASIAHASRLIVPRSESDRLTKDLEKKLEVMFAKDPEHAERLVWEAGTRIGMEPIQIRQIIKEYTCD